jgi:hypothetical protein
MAVYQTVDQKIQGENPTSYSLRLKVISGYLETGRHLEWYLAEGCPCGQQWKKPERALGPQKKIQ